MKLVLRQKGEWNKIKSLARLSGRSPVPVPLLLLNRSWQNAPATCARRASERFLLVRARKSNGKKLARWGPSTFVSRGGVAFAFAGVSWAVNRDWGAPVCVTHSQISLFKEQVLMMENDSPYVCPENLMKMPLASKRIFKFRISVKK